MSGTNKPGNFIISRDELVAKAKRAGAWMRNGICPRTLKPRARWVPAFSPDRCATHDGRGIGSNGESYPVAHGWDCAGCRLDPVPPPTVKQIAALSAGNRALIINPSVPLPNLKAIRP